MMNVIMMQHHIFNANTSMDISTMMNILTTQLGTSCVFDRVSIHKKIQRRRC